MNFLVISVVLPLVVGFVSGLCRLRDERDTITSESDDGAIYFTKNSNKPLSDMLKSGILFGLFNTLYATVTELAVIGLYYINGYNIFLKSSKGRPTVVLTWGIILVILLCYNGFGTTANKENAAYGDDKLSSVFANMGILFAMCIIIACAGVCL